MAWKHVAVLALAACTAAPPAVKPAAVAWPVPAGWRSEIIPFPLDFAPALPHHGKEEIRFPPGFFEPAAGDYWSYVFVWRLDDAAQLDGATVGAELTAYFRGLVAAVDTEHHITTPEQIAVHAEGVGTFQLTAHVFDAFKTAAPLDLVGSAERRACGAGALWVFVLAPSTTTIRAQLDELARAAGC